MKRLEMRLKMKFIALTSIVLVAMSLSGTAADRDRKMNFQGIFLYDSVPNEELYRDMLTHCRDFCDQVKDPALKSRIRSFSSQVSRSHKKDSLAWIGETFAFVDELKGDYPPLVASVYDPSEGAIIRKNIMLLLDFPMHCNEMGSDAESGVIRTYPHERDLHMLRTHEQLMHWLNLPAPADNEIMVAKVYSSGLLFRTAEHMLALDVRWQGSEDDATEICRRADLFVLTHDHDDHYSLNILERMMIMGKSVVVPSNDFYETRIPNLLASYSGENKFLWDGPMGTVFPETQVGPARIKAVMGAQGSVPCLLYMIEMDGWTVAAVGDNSHNEFQGCYGEWDAPDFVCTPIFQGFRGILGEIRHAPNPCGRTTYYVPLHENEMHHGVSHRVGYRFLYYHGDAFGGEEYDAFVPYILLDGGESIKLSR